MFAITYVRCVVWTIIIASGLLLFIDTGYAVAFGVATAAAAYCSWKLRDAINTLRERKARVAVLSMIANMTLMLYGAIMQSSLIWCFGFFGLMFLVFGALAFDGEQFEESLSTRS